MGYGQLSVDAVVRRAGVGKAAVYRRWPNKRAMAVALIAKAAVREELAPDTGTLHGDVTMLMSQMCQALRHPLASRVIPAVAAEAGRDRELELMLRDTVEAPRRTGVSAIIQRAIARGELPSDCDVELALDLLAGPLYWTLLVRRRDLDAAGLARLTEGVLAAIAAIRRSPASAR